MKWMAPLATLTLVLPLQAGSLGTESSASSRITLTVLPRVSVSDVDDIYLNTPLLETTASDDLCLTERAQTDFRITSEDPAVQLQTASLDGECPGGERILVQVDPANNDDDLVRLRVIPE